MKTEKEIRKMLYEGNIEEMYKSLFHEIEKQLEKKGWTTISDSEINEIGNKVHLIRIQQRLLELGYIVIEKRNEYGNLYIYISLNI